MSCKCLKKKSKFVGTYNGTFNRTQIVSSSLIPAQDTPSPTPSPTPTSTYECGKLNIEITQPDPCNKCVHLIVLSYTPNDAVTNFVPIPISLLGTLDCDGNITAAGSVSNEAALFSLSFLFFDGTVIHKFCIKECNLEHTVSRNYSNGTEDPETKVIDFNQYWSSECNSLKKYKKKPECNCQKK